MRTLKQLNAVCDKIIYSDTSDRVKAIKLKGLLAEMERTFKTPIHEESNPELLLLYRKVFGSYQIGLKH